MSAIEYDSLPGTILIIWQIYAYETLTLRLNYTLYYKKANAFRSPLNQSPRDIAYSKNGVVYTHLQVPQGGRYIFNVVVHEKQTALKNHSVAYDVIGSGRCPNRCCMAN